MEFDFGPISRTVEASTGKGNAINFASLPIHEVMVALLASSNRDEFVAWLWHDLFKPLFWWQWNGKKHKFNWIHYPNNRPNHPLNAEAHWSSVTNIPSGLVSTHHYSNRKLKFSERETVNNEFDQVAIGRKARFIQLSFLAEPATHTALLRAVIADAFLEVVTSTVAEAIREELETKTPKFKRVHYIFDFKQSRLSNSPTSAEIASLANQYSILTRNAELVIKHLTPLAKPYLEERHIDVVIDLTAEPPTAERFDQGMISLVELLVVYQDGRTILMGIPQFLKVNIGQIRQQVKDTTERRLRQLDIQTLASRTKLKKQIKVQGRVDWNSLSVIQQGQEIDLLAHVFDEQIEIRLIDQGQLTQRIKVRDDKGKIKEQGIRWLSEIVSRPIDLVQNKSRRCRFCNSAFGSAFPPGEAVVGYDFTDVEHVSFGGDICPMCRVYMLNSHKRTATERAQGLAGDRKGYRGAFALISPSSHFTYDDDRCKLIEQPPLDIGGRFASSPQRVTVTLQEYGLFLMLSRRFIARIWAQLEADSNMSRPLPLPYLGAILLTQNNSKQIRKLFESLGELFEQVRLRAYPFEVIVRPSVELAFEMAINDLQRHHTKHTYLKTSPTIVPVAPDSKFTVLVDNKLQIEISREFFEDQRRMDKLLKDVRGQERRRNWLLAVLQGEDPVSATVEAFCDRDDQWAFRQAEKTLWDAQWGTKPLAEQWRRYEETRDEVQSLVAKYPMLIEFFVKPRRR